MNEQIYPRITVLYKPALKPCRERIIPNTLEVCQKLVGGNIEVVRLLPGVLLVCNEEGRLLNLPPNPYAGAMLFGDWFICGECGEEFADVPRAYVRIARQHMTILREAYPK